MATITKSLTIESQGTYNLTFDLWSYSEWAASAGITTSYASLAALIADEKAVRQLMTVHASVDYFANCPDSTIISTVINNDLCAKWINLRDYALDTLSAKSNIKSVMDTADKYGYGEWGKINSTTWGPLGNVPIMTSNTAPYGVASAYQVFDGNASTSASGTDFSYQSVNPICVKRYKALGANGATITGTIQGSNDGSKWTNINLASNTTYYMYHRLHLGSSTAVYTLQFYGRELKPLIPTMTSNTAPIGEALQHVNTVDEAYIAYRAFDGTSGTWAGSGYAASGHNGEYIQYNAPAIRAGFKPKKIYINEGRSESNRVVSCQYTAIMSDDNFATTKTVATLETSVASGVAVLADINTNLTKGIRLVCNSSNGNLNYSHSKFGMVYYYIMGTIQIYGFDYSEKEFAQGSTRKTIYDHGVAPNGRLTVLAGTGIAEEQSNQLYVKVTAANAVARICTTDKITFSSQTYNYLRAVIGNRALRTNGVNLPFIDVADSQTTAGVGTAYKIPTMTEVANSPRDAYTLSIASITQDKYIRFVAENGATALTLEAAINELWLE